MERVSRAVAIILLCLLTAACSRGGPPAPVSHYGLDAPAGGGNVTVRGGDTVYAISRRYGVPLRDLIDENGLAHPYVIHPGQQLRLPAPRVYTVAAGDTLYSVSRQHGVDVTALVRVNDLAPPYTLVVGQTLRLPAASGQMHATSMTATAAAPGTVAAPASPAASPTPSASVTTAPLPPPVTTAALPAPVPATSTTQAAPAPSPAILAPPAQTATATAPAPSTTLSAAAPARPAPATPAPVPASATPAPAVASRIAPSAPGTLSFLWPVEGKLVSGFGPKEAGLHNDGINIAAKAGTAVLAAEGGEVVYAGNEIRGFGNLLLIRHEGGWMTAYAHNDRLLVRKGEKVQRGQAVATVGSTGAVSSPQLHFEIRKGSRAVDPAEYLNGGRVVPVTS